VLSSMGGLAGLMIGAGGTWLLGMIVSALPTHPPWLYVLLAEILGVSHKSPAKKAGFQKGDIIRILGGQSITSLADLKLVLFYSNIGNRLKIQFERAGNTPDKEIELFHPSFREK